jgi:hypothetical protein
MKSKIKKTLYTLIAMIGFANFTMAQVPSYVPTNGLVAWYPFNGNSNDESGAVNNLNNNGAVLIMDRFGNINSAYHFGANNSLSKATPNTNGQNFTWSFWLKNNSSNSDIYFGEDNNTSNSGGGFSFGPNKKIPQFICQGIATNVTKSSFVINNTDWFHYVITKSNSDFKIFINGQQNSSGSSAYLPYNSTTQFRILTLSNGNLELDDIGMWNTVLTQSEISALYNGCNLSNVNIVPNGVTTFCQGNSVSLNANKVNANYTYSWNLNGSPISGANSSSYIATQPGSYSLKIDSVGCSATSPAVNVNVNALPSINFSINPYINIQQNTFSLTATPAGGTYTGVGVTSNGNFNPSLANLGAKTIYYTYTDGNNCTNIGLANTLVYDTIRCFVRDTIRFAVTDTLIINAKLTGLNPPNNLNTLKVYPNPANTHITIDYGNFVNMNGYKVKVVNMAGQTVFTTIINQQTSYIDVSTWSGKGIYFLQLIDTQNNTIENRKIVLQ